MFQQTQRIRFTDIDVVGNVNYAVYLQLVDDAVIEWWHNDLATANTNLSVVAVWMIGSWKKPIETPGPVAVTLQLTDVRRTSFELHGEVSHPHGGLAFACRTRYVVCVNSQPTPLPSSLRESLTQRVVDAHAADILRSITDERRVTTSAPPSLEKDLDK